jgi:Ca2+-transporting ATPase
MDAYQMTLGQIAARVKADTQNGLSSQEALERLSYYGPNLLPEKKPVSAVIILIRQALSPLMFVLLFAALASIVIAEYNDAIVIGLAALINIVVGFIQEWKAERAAEALRAYEVLKATVRRNGQIVTIDSKDLVPGDLVLLAAGSRVPADVRLSYVNDFMVEEALLTGESAPITKTIEVLRENLSIGDRTNMAYAGTYAVSGKAEGIVTATGSLTALGDIVRLVMQTEEQQTPLQQQIKKFSWLLGAVMGIVTLGIIILGLLKGFSLHKIFTLSIALAVAAIPEGLLVAVTVILAVGMQRMLKRKALVRRLVAAETLGSVSVICTDKTGTITQGRMAVVRAASPKYDYTLPDSDTLPDEVCNLFRACILNNDAQLSSDRRHRAGDPTEIALLEVGYDSHINVEQERNNFIRLREIPFDAQLKYMATVHKLDDREWLIVKGAPETIFPMCDNSVPIDRFTKLTQDMTNEGLRVLAIADKISDKIDLEHDLTNLHCLGLVGMQDPLRPGAAKTVQELRQAGIQIVIVTGDHSQTAVRIAHGAGIPVRSDGVLLGSELAQLSDAQLKEQITKIDVFARVDPSQKIRIVDAWQEQKKTVAMTGDGVNDAPALKAADIGVSVGSGSDVAHEISDMVLLDDNLATIAAAVKQGRIIFDNIRKVVVYLMVDSFSEIILIVGALLLGLPLPFYAVQILWINLVTDGFPDIALTMEPGEPGIMRQLPRPKAEPVINREMMFLIFIVGIITDLGLFGLYVSLLNFDFELLHIRTIMFTALGIDSLLYVFSVRSLHASLFRVNPFRNLWLIAAVVAGFMIQLSSLYVPFLQKLLSTVALDMYEWGIILVLSFIKIIGIELTKMWFIAHEKVESKKS